MKQAAVVLFAVLMCGCNFLHDDDPEPQPGCEQVCTPCSGSGEVKVYSGEIPRVGIYGAPLHYQVCVPNTEAMAADHVCFQDTHQGGVQPVCFYGCGEGETCHPM